MAALVLPKCCADDRQKSTLPRSGKCAGFGFGGIDRHRKKDGKNLFTNWIPDFVGRQVEVLNIPSLALKSKRWPGSKHHRLEHNLPRNSLSDASPKGTNSHIARRTRDKSFPAKFAAFAKGVLNPFPGRKARAWRAVTCGMRRGKRRGVLRRFGRRCVCWQRRGGTRGGCVRVCSLWSQAISGG